MKAPQEEFILNDFLVVVTKILEDLLYKTWILTEYTVVSMMNPFAVIFKNYKWFRIAI